MTDWINGVCDRVDRLTEQEPYYQELAGQLQALESRYSQLLAQLPEADREIILEHTYLLTEMAYQRTQTAYRVGVEISKEGHA